MTKLVLALVMVVVVSLDVSGGGHAKAAADSRSLGSVSASTIVQTAEKYLGYPYVANGRSPDTGFSDVGFVSYVFRSEGIKFPRSLRRALRYAPHVAMTDLQPGDVVFFKNTIRRGLSHIAIYVGGGTFIHAEWYNRGVTITSFSNDATDGNYWIDHYLGANRPVAPS
jgi:cell wall-associated NlpC family hydrolase